MGEARSNVILLSVFSFLLWASLGALAPIEFLFLGSLVENVAIRGLILGIPGLVIMVFAPCAIKNLYTLAIPPAWAHWAASLAQSYPAFWYIFSGSR